MYHAECAWKESTKPGQLVLFIYLTRMLEHFWRYPTSRKALSVHLLVHIPHLLLLNRRGGGKGVGVSLTVKYGSFLFDHFPLNTQRLQCAVQNAVLIKIVPKCFEGQESSIRLECDFYVKQFTLHSWSETMCFLSPAIPLNRFPQWLHGIPPWTWTLWPFNSSVFSAIKSHSLQGKSVLEE